MKKSFLMLALSVGITQASMAQTVVLQGNIAANRTLDRDTCYLLRGCVTVDSNVTLTIQSGTKIFGEKATVGGLIIKRGARINAIGTASQPIIFTSNQAAGSRKAGDWAGIIIAGRAKSNQGSFQVEGPCVPIFAGGSLDNDNSGTLQYVQIHYAGAESTATPPGSGNEMNSLTLAAVGSGTTIDHIQVTYANDDAYEWFGGTVNAKYLVAYNTRDDDFDTDFGYSGKVQFGFAFRTDSTYQDVSTSNGIESDNNATGTGATPKTKAIFSNMTIIGPAFCGTPHGIYSGRGAHIRRNSAQTVYNSVFAGWKTGYYLDGDSTIKNTSNADVPVANANQLDFSYNTVMSNTTAYAHTPATWTGCGASMTEWITGAGAATCREAGNVVTGTLSGLQICGATCPTSPNVLVNSTNNVGTSNYTPGDLSDAFFIKTAGTLRGAFGTSASSNWTSGWTNWCPNNAIYSCASALSGEEATKDASLLLAPNPSNGQTYALFEATNAGEVMISILDKVSGRTLRSTKATVTAAGSQRIAFDAGGLQTGVYSVIVEMSNGFRVSALLSVQ